MSDIFVQCKSCEGSGLVKSKLLLCKNCNGKKCYKCKGTGYRQYGYTECEICAGSGIVLKVHSKENIEKSLSRLGLK
tara:strand:- start:184 stop:414 length:231 start_codon:yes stop_codon:yes gene_type:complete